MGRKTLNQQSQLLNDIHHFSVNYDTREIFFHSSTLSDEDVGIDFRVSTGFIKNIRFLNSINQNPILIHMNSDGGCSSHGLAIYDAIKSSKAHITIICSGMVASMATVILQSADTRILHPNCTFLVHHGWISMPDMHQIAAKSALEHSEQFIEKMLDIYSERCVDGEIFVKNKMKKDAVKAYINTKMKDKHDWYLTAKDAVQYGFVDGILGDDKFTSIETLRDV